LQQKHIKQKGSGWRINLHIFLTRKIMPTLSRTVGRNLASLNIFLKTKHQSKDVWYVVSVNLILPLYIFRLLFQGTAVEDIAGWKNA
jgi:hypothetical protein